MEEYLFFAECTQGYGIKVLIDGLCSTFNRCFFRFSENGIFMKQMDGKKIILFNIELLRQNFIQYICKNEITFSINILHFQKLIKSLKKKNSLTLFIQKDNPLNLGIITKTNSNEKTSKIKKSFITINRELIEDFKIPSGYKFPKVVKSSEFLEIKGVLIDKNVKIKMQDSNYLSFESLLGAYSSTLEFGELVYGINIYEQEFTSAIINQIIKFPNLGSQMQFYKPPELVYPLLIKMQISLGSIEIYIKDNQQCEKDKLMLNSIN